MTAPYSFARRARTWPTALTVAVIWAALWAAWVWLDAALWIIALVLLFTLPALLDLIRNPQSGLSINAQGLHWHSGRRHASLDLEEVDHIRLDTRLDFSVRATAVLRNGRKIRLPFEATPPHRAFEAALDQHGIKTQRHHFQLLQ